jgi:hypothetical protein
MWQHSLLSSRSDMMSKQLAAASTPACVALSYIQSVFSLSISLHDTLWLHVGGVIAAITMVTVM